MLKFRVWSISSRNPILLLFLACIAWKSRTANRNLQRSYILFCFSTFKKTRHEQKLKTKVFQAHRTALYFGGFIFSPHFTLTVCIFVNHKDLILQRFKDIFPKVTLTALQQLTTCLCFCFWETSRDCTFSKMIFTISQNTETFSCPKRKVRTTNSRSPS